MIAGQPRALELLCASGATLLITENTGHTPLEFSLRHGTSIECDRVLVANGVRLGTVREEYRRHITPELEAFERGVLSCREAVVVLLGLKRRRGDVMRDVDRWVVREIAFACWATRTDRAWQQSL